MTKKFWYNLFTAFAIDVVDFVPIILGVGQVTTVNFIFTLIQIEMAYRTLPSKIVQIGSLGNYAELMGPLPGAFDQFLPTYTAAVIINRGFPNLSIHWLDNIHAVVGMSVMKTERNVSRKGRKR